MPGRYLLLTVKKAGNFIIGDGFVEIVGAKSAPARIVPAKPDARVDVVPKQKMRDAKARAELLDSQVSVELFFKFASLTS